MTVLEMFSQSGILTLLGIGVVFFFLIIMILAMIALHAVVHALKWDTEPAGEQPVAAPSPSVSVPDAFASCGHTLLQIFLSVLFLFHS